MDAADWYVNLALRQWTAGEAGGSWRAFVQHHPIVRRGNALADAWLFNELPPELRAIIEERDPPAGIEYLRAEELYFFERRLPEHLRQFGRTCRFGKGGTPVREAPAGFLGPVDHLFEQRSLSVFVRVDLSRPDDVLVNDLREFLARERRAFAALGGEQPYRDALATLGKYHRANLQTFASLRLLAYLDLAQWARDSGATITNAQYADLLSIGDDRLQEVEAKAALVLKDFFLRGWLLPAAREALRESIR